MKVLKSCRILLVFTSILLILSGCDITFFNPKGIISAQQKDLFLIIVGLMMIVIIPVLFLSIWIPIRYRESNKKATYDPSFFHSTKLELICWGIPIIIISILGVIIYKTSHSLDPSKSIKSENKEMIIEAVALEWKWLFIYPEQGVASLNTVSFPVNTPIRFKITADAPMNTLLIPALGGQIYAMGGMSAPLNLLANEIGDYRGGSANFSGEWFADMTFIAHVTSKEDFEKWVKSAKASKVALSNDYYDIVSKKGRNKNIEYYSSVAPNLYNRILGKYMMHDMSQEANMEKKGKYSDTKTVSEHSNH